MENGINMYKIVLDLRIKERIYEGMTVRLYEGTTLRGNDSTVVKVMAK